MEERKVGREKVGIGRVEKSRRGDCGEGLCSFGLLKAPVLDPR